MKRHTFSEEATHETTPPSKQYPGLHSWALHSKLSYVGKIMVKTAKNLYSCTKSRPPSHLFISVNFIHMQLPLDRRV